MMDQQAIVDAVHASTTEVFDTMMEIKIVPQDVFTETQAPGPSDGVIAIVGLAGAWVGTTSISCSAEFACRISSAMLGAEYTAIDEDVLDAVAEISNMVAGNFKNAAEKDLGPLGLSIPTVIYGFGFSARTVGKEKWVVVPFSCDHGTFEVKVCLTVNRGLAHLPKAVAA